MSTVVKNTCASLHYWSCFRSPPAADEQKEQQLGSPNSLSIVPSTGTPKLPAEHKKKPGGWRAMPYVLGNETCERLATVGLFANFQVYLIREFHLEQAKAAQLLNVWNGFTNFMPLFGAFICDAYIGRFKTIAFSVFAELLGMVTVTLTAWLPQLRPPKCDVASKSGVGCLGATSGQLGVLLTGMCLLSVGTGGIRPCSIPFGVDQFDARTEEGVKGINSFFNWYYTTFTVVILLSLTVIVYIQDSFSWVVGFGIPTVFMVVAIILFFIGRRIYVHVKPEGSVFSGIANVFCAAYKKRKLKLDEEDDEVAVLDGKFYDPPAKATVIHKLPLTKQFRFLNKAALIQEGEVNESGQPSNPRSLVSIQEVEEVKCLLKVIPVWSAGIISLTAISQQGTFTVSQAMIMDRHLGPKFEIPPGTMTVISLIVIGLWVPFYDRILVPRLRRITKYETGITLLQRVGIGIVFSVLSMVVAGLVERDRRGFANAHPHAPPVSVMWLAPHLVIMGMCEAFLFIGQIEFFNKEFPENMRSFANALFSVSFAIANYLSSVLITVIRKTTGGGTRPDWLTNDLNQGRLDLFYFVLAGMGLLNFFYFVLCARRYRYKTKMTIEVDVDGSKLSSFHDVEMNSAKGYQSATCSPLVVLTEI
ncbi:Protein NRT1/ PTR FAMILY 2.13 [Linum grandiflorum]